MLSQHNPGNLVAPCYHVVAERPLPHIRQLYPFRDPVEFKRELDWLLARFQPVSLEDIVASQTKGTALPVKSLFLSFDDGFREMAEIVAPICKREGVPATFFLITDFLDNRKLGFRHKASLLLETLSALPPEKAQAILWETARLQSIEYRESVCEFVLGVGYTHSSLLDEAARLAGLDFQDYLRRESPYLSSKQVRGLLEDGFSIGAHSLDHPRYSEISIEQQIMQTSGSVEYLVRNFGMKHRAFAFPFVSDGVSEDFYRRVFSEHICDVVFCIGATPSTENWPIVERFGVERNPSEPIWTILRTMNRRRLRRRVSRWISPLRRLIK